VVFNLVTAGVALALLPWMITALAWARAALELPPDPATKLALFHTSFNLLGVALMWPLAAPLTRWLQQRFRQREEDEAQPRHLDDNVLTVPALALDALALECARIGGHALHLARSALRGTPAAALQAEHGVVQQLDDAAARFVERMSRGEMPQATAARLALTLRRLRYHETTAELAVLAAGLRPLAAAADAALLERQQGFEGAVDATLALCEQVLPQAAGTGPAVPAPTAAGAEAPADDRLQAALAHVEQHYQALKSALLAGGAAGVVSMAAMEEALRRHSALRRAAQQAVKAALSDPARLGPGTDDAHRHADARQDAAAAAEAAG
jgi:phosphate:Na+ symporter